MYGSVRSKSFSPILSTCQRQGFSARDSRQGRTLQLSSLRLSAMRSSYTVLRVSSRRSHTCRKGTPMCLGTSIPCSASNHSRAHRAGVFQERCNRYQIGIQSFCNSLIVTLGLPHVIVLFSALVRPVSSRSSCRDERTSRMKPWSTLPSRPVPLYTPAYVPSVGMGIPTARRIQPKYKYILLVQAVLHSTLREKIT